jgi:hypothetical protein
LEREKLPAAKVRRQRTWVAKHRPERRKGLLAKLSAVLFCHEGEVSEASFADDALASMAYDFNAMKITATA